MALLCRGNGVGSSALCSVKAYRFVWRYFCERWSANWKVKLVGMFLASIDIDWRVIAFRGVFWMVCFLFCSVRIKGFKTFNLFLFYSWDWRQLFLELFCGKIIRLLCSVNEQISLTIKRTARSILHKESGSTWLCKKEEQISGWFS